MFRAFSTFTTDIEEKLPEGVLEEKLYIVGYKNFWISNGIIYSHRNSDNYFEKTVTLDEKVLRNNHVLKERLKHCNLSTIPKKGAQTQAP